MNEDKEIRIAGIVRESIVDGPGLRFTLFVQGCPHKCPECHNPQTHDFNGGQIVSHEKVLNAIFDNPLLSGVTFSGGEPFMQAESLYLIGKEIKNKGLNLITYTGFLFEDLLTMSENDPYILKLIKLNDYIMDGKFQLENKTYDKTFVGSSNQRRIDVKKTIENNFKVIEKDF
ncbi:anaerobic ribonucleoside-triphosphate reductase activating protein [Anaerofustis stercorihominis]|uniref:Anaerobic ribonucleoside-triphosphate reductase-activating protein n=2 Tax=Anaerofustis stercorihominis TaxID=214853 RepID=B1C8M1_9FIRM|nr:anaerobic ribonucleoside-triphosphate reductase activating protein [Anaerofustis stercorihominis]EDS71931.1 anaerobic ribonucleoside-triphosphate reductase activating protein [Anaerofustis stercorihominis DSM 17244]MCQ4796038.1 anaerobic ribonucleoside-triphosphate reductase activating protein [Anaerofustis stercorihominis]RGD75018.1 anaerobic ribonucleoside-triphosphate reductase activating protein [Anaerofustis stercorihominis]